MSRWFNAGQAWTNKGRMEPYVLLLSLPDYALHIMNTPFIHLQHRVNHAGNSSSDAVLLL